MDKQDSFVPLCHTHSHKYTKGIGRWWYVCCVNFVHKITRHNFTRSLSFVVAVTLFQPSEQPNRIGACVHINELFFSISTFIEWMNSVWVEARAPPFVAASEAIDLFRLHSSTVYTIQTNTIAYVASTKSMLTELWVCWMFVRISVQLRHYHRHTRRAQLVSTIAIIFLLSSNFPNGRVNRVTQFLGAGRFFLCTPTNQ